MKKSYILRNVRRGLDETEPMFALRLAEILRLDVSAFTWSIWRDSLDARGTTPFWIVQVRLDFEPKLPKHLANVVEELHLPDELVLQQPKQNSDRPIVVGFGPAGMFAAYALAQKDYCPIVFERGGDVAQRQLAVNRFWQTGQLDLVSNVAFGEGGAGTFSDGKLVSRSKDTLSHTVFDILVEHGAPATIKHNQKPHIGTDLLVDIVASMRRRIIEWGGEVHFGVKVDSLIVEYGAVKGVRVANEAVYSSKVIVAMGHSARDTMRHLATIGGVMESKPFAVGFRIEHEQEALNRAQYGEFYNHPSLGAAAYALAGSKSPRAGNSDLSHQVYTFCMCPGGVVVNASSELGELAVNGMSYQNRAGRQGNSAIVCQVDSSDYGHSLFGGMEFQQKLEQQAFRLGGSDFSAPCQRVADFLANRPTRAWGRVVPTVLPKATMSNLRGLLPKSIETSICEALPQFRRKLSGFGCAEDVLTAVETRTSSPIRLVRQRETLMWQGVSGVFPLGEGAGYAGGITSAAIDGLRGATAVASSY